MRPSEALKSEQLEGLTIGASSVASTAQPIIPADRLRRPLNFDVMRQINQRKVHPASTSWDSWSHHLIYDHGYVPNSLGVSCPRCESEAVAKRAAPREPYSITCLSCPYRAVTIAFENLPPLFYKVAEPGTELWAWNREHLLFLRDYLKSPHSPLLRRDIYGPYVRREWLLKRRALVRAIGRRLLPYNHALQRTAASGRR